jgi:bacterioferritin-associated ferredoxin
VCVCVCVHVSITVVRAAIDEYIHKKRRLGDKESNI